MGFNSGFKGLNSPQSPASGVGKVGEHRLTSKVGRVRKVVSAQVSGGGASIRLLM